MKKYFTLVFLSFLINFSLAQAPANYYNGTATLTGAALKTKLSQIITNGHSDQGYGGLWTAYATTDRDFHYENDGTILDIYSENPNGADPYNYTLTTNQCGSNNGPEGTCYNREHIVPQSLFDLNNNGSGDAPMVSDVHFIRATDYQVNGKRSNFPFGKVGTTSWTSMNGSKLGNSVSSGYSGTVFEPIDAFKGDVARMIFYFVTRYESQLSTFSSGNMLGSSPFPGLENWQLQQLLAWHTLDPVSPAEIARNNASYNFQGNRNPYIDNPQWVYDVWGTADSTPPSTPTSLVTSNPTANSISLNWTASTDNVAVSGYDIYVNGVYHSTVSGTSATISGLASSTTYSFHIIAKDTSGNASTASNTATGTTLASTTPPSSGTEIYFSEYVEGSGTNKALEITNPTSSAIDLSVYSVQKQANGTGNWINNLPLSGTLQPGATYILKHSTTAFSCTFTANQTAGGSPLDFNGNDPVGLFKNGNLIDIIGTFDGGTANFAIDVTLRRIVIGPNPTFNIANWASFPQNACDNLGIANPDANMGTLNISSQKSTAIYPNPVTNGELFVSGENLNKIQKAEIYTLDGRLMQKEMQPFKNSNKILLKNLPKGIYILKADEISEKFIIK